MTGDGEATAYIHDRWCFAGWQVVVLGTGGERPKDALLGRGTYLRRARTYTGQGGVEAKVRCWGEAEAFLGNVSVSPSNGGGVRRVLVLSMPT